MKTQNPILDPVSEALKRFDPRFVPIYVHQYDDRMQVDLIVTTQCLDSDVYNTLRFQFIGLFRIVSFVWISKDSDGNDRYSVVLKADRLHVQPPISEKE